MVEVEEVPRVSSATTCVFLCIEVSGEDKGREMSLLFEGSLVEMEKSRC